uniref:Uncharacterized protein n=1 Tax=Alsidium seaforthii TaxID=2007182 RepID=A0A1Z1MDD0_9FLOR|nr:hypothetical protein [Bryothamnion seaforthii]ARW63882.1 hypothetical protein [Bryothamnion seaforthii]
MPTSLFLCLLRLPFIARTNPVVNAGLMVIATIFTYQIGNTIISVNEPARRFTPFSIANYFVSKFLKNRDLATNNRTYWFLKTGFSLVSFLVSSIGYSRRNGQNPNQVQPDKMPDLLAGKIDSRHIINNMQGQTFIIRVSDKAINYIGFIVILIRSVLVCIGVVVVARHFLRKLQETLRKESIIHVEARSVSEKKQNS